MIPISTVERETGLSKDTLRKWEVRYGFPHPSRNLKGTRYYTKNDLDRLLTIKRLLDSGLRPSRVVPLAPAELDALVVKPSNVGISELNGELLNQVWQALKAYSPSALKTALNRALLSHGLNHFVLAKMPSLNQMVGDGWASGTLAVHQEHLYAETVRTLLLVAIERLQPMHGKPRILLSTPPDERHDLGILMVQSILALSGAHCISLGSETPATELAAAALNLQVQVIALSFSIGFPSRRILPFLEQVHVGLPETIQVWAGGAGVDRLRQKLPGTHTFASIESAAAALSSLPGLV